MGKGEDGVQITFMIHTTLKAPLLYISIRRQSSIQFQALQKLMPRFDVATCC